MENQHRKIKTYRELSQEEIELMNEGKELEKQVLSYVAKLKENSETDKRWVAMGKTDAQVAFMKLIRSVAKPEEI